MQRDMNNPFVISDSSLDLEGLLLEDAGLVCAGAKEKTNNISWPLW